MGIHFSKTQNLRGNVGGLILVATLSNIALPVYREILSP